MERPAKMPALDSKLDMEPSKFQFSPGTPLVLARPSRDSGGLPGKRKCIEEEESPVSRQPTMLTLLGGLDHSRSRTLQLSRLARFTFFIRHPNLVIQNSFPSKKKVQRLELSWNSLASWQINQGV